MSFISNLFHKPSNLEKFLALYNSDNALDSLYEKHGIGAILAVMFLKFSQSTLRDEDLNKYTKTKNSELIFFEIVWFNFFSIVNIVDQFPDSNDPNFGKSVLECEIFQETFLQMVLMFSDLSRCDKQACLARMKAYYGSNKRLNQDQLSTICYQYLVTTAEQEIPALEPSLENMFKLDLMGTAFLMNFPNIILASYQEPMMKSLFGFLDHYNKKHLLFKQVKKTAG